jgi:hypothetical protein
MTGCHSMPLSREGPFLLVGSHTPLTPLPANAGGAALFFVAQSHQTGLSHIPTQKSEANNKLIQ